MTNKEAPLKTFFIKMLYEFASLKFQLVYISTLLFFFDKLSENGWLTAVLSVTGMRVINEVSGMVKDVNISNVLKKPKGKKNVNEE